MTNDSSWHMNPFTMDASSWMYLIISQINGCLLVLGNGFNYHLCRECAYSAIPTMSLGMSKWLFESKSIGPQHENELQNLLYRQYYVDTRRHGIYLSVFNSISHS